MAGAGNNDRGVGGAHAAGESTVTGGFFVPGRCWSCKKPFTFNPVRVPSVMIDPKTNRPPDVDEDGSLREPSREEWDRSSREPFCETCIELVNEHRVERGQRAIEILPGAYDWVEGLPE